MKNYYFFIIGILLSTTVTMSQNKDIITDQVKAVERQFCQAQLAKDSTKLQSLLSDNFVGIGHLGNLVDKSQYLRVHLSPDRRFVIYQTSDVEATIIAEQVVLLTGEVIIQQAQDSPDNVIPKRYAATYRQEGKAWQLVSWQDTPIRQEQTDALLEK